jgi:hypothetical protein
MTTRVFDRIPRFDKRSRQFPIRPLIAATKRRSYTWSCKYWLDQGSEGACVGFGWTHEAGARPKVVPNLTNSIARKVYKLAQTYDEWPGEDYEGSSVLGGAKAAEQMGWLVEYRWCFSEDNLAMTVGYKGPVVLGINWYEGMSDTDKDGIVTATGDLLGGHCILCNGISLKKGLYRLHNSWGKVWGINGDCFVSFEDMKKLLNQDGEACIPVIRKV